MLASCYAKEPVFIPRKIGFVKKMLFYFTFSLRHVLFAFITNISSFSLNGTDLIILAVKEIGAVDSVS